MNCLDTEKFSMVHITTGWPVLKMPPLKSAVPADAWCKERDFATNKTHVKAFLMYYLILSG